MTTTLSEDDVRRLVMEDWTDSGPDGRDVVRREALFTRCPGCQPCGLRWSTSTVHSYGFYLDGPSYLALSAIIDLILMSIARDGTNCNNLLFSRSGVEYWSESYYDFANAVMSGDLPGTVVARHRLADLKEQTE